MTMMLVPDHLEEEAAMTVVTGECEYCHKPYRGMSELHDGCFRNITPLDTALADRSEEMNRLTPLERAHLIEIFERAHEDYNEHCRPKEEGGDYDARDLETWEALTDHLVERLAIVLGGNAETPVYDALFVGEEHP